MWEKLQNKGVALCITAGVVLLSVLGGAKLSLTRLRVEAMDSGAVTNYGDAMSMAQSSDNLLTVAGYYLDDSHPRFRAVEEAIEALEDAGTAEELAVAAEELWGAVGDLDDHLQTMDMDGQDSHYRESLVNDIRSDLQRLNRGLQSLGNVEWFNRQLQRFPANILSTIVGVDPLDYSELY